MPTSRAIFFDLQGTLGGSGLDDVLSFEFFPFASEALALAKSAGFLAIIVTNQAHIADGLFTEEDFWLRMKVLEAKLNEAGTNWDGVYMCPHRDHHNCECKKPKPGMLVEAAQDFSLNLADCFVVGDAGAWDILLAQAAGAGSVLVKTGLGPSSLREYRYTWENAEPDFIAGHALEAVQWITRHPAA